MPSRTLPSFTRAQVESHSTEKSCYVTVGEIVYDVTDFLDSHPGGAELVMEYAGKDITEILMDEASHRHSEAAYEVLDDSIIGYLGDGKSTNDNGHGTGVDINGNGTSTHKTSNGAAINPRTGMTNAEDLSRDTDMDTDFKTHKFLDLNKPLFLQVWRGNFSREFYMDQIHRPRHYKGGASAPLFGNFLEPLSKTAWWVIPLVWWPQIAYGTYRAAQGLSGSDIAWYWVMGLGLWTFFEYILHRFLFHLDDYLPDNRVGVTAHFLLHGIHHYLPMDKYRLVMPPTLFCVLALPVWYLAKVIFYWDWHVALAVFAGGVFGYTIYDMTHYFLHHQNLPLWYKQLKKYHLEHHFLDYENGFGVTSRFWDRVFGTEIKSPLVRTK